MSKHLNPLEKEFLIRQYKSNPRIMLSDFCDVNHMKEPSFLMVLTGIGDYAYRRADGVYVVPIGCLKA